MHVLVVVVPMDSVGLPNTISSTVLLAGNTELRLILLDLEVKSFSVNMWSPYPIAPLQQRVSLVQNILWERFHLSTVVITYCVCPHCIAFDTINILFW